MRDTAGMKKEEEQNTSLLVRERDHECVSELERSRIQKEGQCYLDLSNRLLVDKEIRVIHILTTKSTVQGNSMVAPWLGD